ncbi:fungal-specific transcription factor domain-containing protein [Exophiala viscosa]|nr:fungal-specific transcription factor domain-containing protein [Exophiala viscosa]
MYDSGKQTDIPRDYVSNLEEQIAELTQEVQALREERNTQGDLRNGNGAGGITTTAASSHSAAAHHERAANVDSEAAAVAAAERPPSLAADETSPLLQDLVTKVRNVVTEPFIQQPRFLGQSSGISFAKMVMAAIHVDDRLSSPILSVPRQQSPSHEASLAGFAAAPAKASMPPRHVADHLVEVYFQYRTPHLPLIGRSQVSKAINSAYAYRGSPSGTGRTNAEVRGVPPERDMFITYMVFAIGLAGVPHTSGSRPSQSDGCFRSALGWVEKVLTYSKSDLETLRIVLLLAQFVALSPSRGSLWHLTGFALRLCIDVGLHWETELQCLNMDPEVLDDRRRLWHSTYHLDRLLCITLGRPFGILDESTRVQLPNPWTGYRHQGLSGQTTNEFDIHTQRAHNHLFTLARLESEIRHVQHGQVWSLRLAYPRPSWTAWLQDIQPRLQEWKATIPDPERAHPSSIFASRSYWDVIYHNTILLLYRPQHAGTMNQSAQELLITFEASCKVIAGLKVLQHEGRLEMLWKSVHQLFMAGLGVINALWHSEEIRESNPVGKSISTLQSCASTLSAMSETFPGAAGCRNAFDTLSSATIDWLVTRDIEDFHQNRLEFENHVRDLMKQLQLPRYDGMTATTTTATTTTQNAQNNHDRVAANNMSAVLSTEGNFDLGELLNTAAQWPDMGELGFIMGEQQGGATISMDNPVPFESNVAGGDIEQPFW